MKDLRKHISENRELFDDKEPSAGHIARFEELLKKQEDHKKPTERKRFITLFSVAASIAIIAMVAFKFYSLQMYHPIANTETSNMMEEFRTTNDFYNQQMEEKIANIMCKLSYTDTENQALLTRDLESIQEANTMFVNEIKNSDDKELAILYLIKHYEQNIQALEYINEKLGKYVQC